MTHKDDEKAAKKYAGKEPTICSTRALETSDREIWEWTRDAFLAGCTHVRTSAEWKAMERVTTLAELYCRTTAGGFFAQGFSAQEVFADLKDALQELDRIRRGK